MTQTLALRGALVLFVLAWLAGPSELRTTVPVWVPFLVALGLELNFFVGGLRRAGPSGRPDRGPQAVDRDLYGYPSDSEELLLVREDGEELWIPYSGEPEEELDALVAEARERPEWAPPAAAPSGFLPAPLRRFLVGIGLIGALALVLWAVERNSGWSGLSADARAAATERMSTEASRLAGKPVRIRCDESGRRVGAIQHSDGVAIVGGDLAYLTPERCFDLYRLAFEGEITSSRTARALAVLAHETWHLRGLRDEGTTECYALQSGVELGRRLGLSAGTARQMMRQQLTENLQHRGSSMEYLVPADCRDGGPLDLDPRSSRFP
jgi:hypothetical protein